VPNQYYCSNQEDSYCSNQGDLRLSTSSSSYTNFAPSSSQSYNEKEPVQLRDAILASPQMVTANYIDGEWPPGTELIEYTDNDGAL
jgi:hypothetical protein